VEIADIEDPGVSIYGLVEVEEFEPLIRVGVVVVGVGSEEEVLRPFVSFGVHLDLEAAGPGSSDLGVQF
jgi:hypothetical protein